MYQPTSHEELHIKTNKSTYFIDAVFFLLTEDMLSKIHVGKKLEVYLYQQLCDSKLACQTL